MNFFRKKKKNTENLESNTIIPPKKVCVRVDVDDFTGEKTAVSESFGSVGSDHFLFMSLMNKGGKDFINLSFHKTFNINLGDKIQILLENGHIVKYDITEKPYNESKGYWSTSFQVLVSDLEILSEQNVDKLRVENISSGKADNYVISPYSYSFHGALGPLEFLDIPSKSIVTDYCSLVQKEIENYIPLAIKHDYNPEVLSNDEEVFVYLMQDIANGYHKIGISNKPNYREKTLQSEKPTIEMVCSKKFPNRKIAFSIEQALHQSYSENRIRGEWFNLEEKDVYDLKMVLS